MSSRREREKRKEIEEIVEEMKVGDREEKGTGVKVKKQRKNNNNKKKKKKKKKKNQQKKNKKKQQNPKKPPKNKQHSPSTFTC